MSRCLQINVTELPACHSALAGATSSSPGSDPGKGHVVPPLSDPGKGHVVPPLSDPNQPLGSLQVSGSTASVPVEI